MDQEQPKFFMLDEGTEDFYKFPDDWDKDDEEDAVEVEIDVDLKKIVIVDSGAFHRNILKTQLEAAGFKIAGLVDSAADAGHILAEAKVRFAAVDIDQTDGGGAKAIQIITSMNPQTVFIATSSRFTSEQISQSGTGNCYFLAKPFQKDKVADVMNKAYEAEHKKKKSAARDAALDQAKSGGFAAK